MPETEALVEFRRRIDDLDLQIVDLLAARLAVCREVGAFKAERGIDVRQPARMKEVKASKAALGEALGLRPDFMRRLYEMIIDEACALEDQILDTSGRNG